MDAPMGLGLRFSKHLQRVLTCCKCSRLPVFRNPPVQSCRGFERLKHSSSSLPYSQFGYTSITQQNVSCSSSLAQEFKRATDEHKKQNIRKVSRCEEHDPVHHTMDQEGLFYTVPDAEVKQLFQRGLSTDFASRAKTFRETCIMVRKPAVEVLKILQIANYNHPSLKFVLYGEKGAGKTTTMAHILHYGARTGCLLVHVPWPAFWVMFARESSVSARNPELRDLPLETLEWLGHFKSQNYKLLQELKTTDTYTWSKREVTDAGSSLMEVVDHGLNRGKHAPDCVGVILKEAKIQATRKRCRLMVAIDGVNGFWRESSLKDEEFKMIPSDKISLIHHFKKLIADEWRNGSIIVSVDSHAFRPHHRDQYTPVALLGKEGFELFDPFIPVRVDNYSDKEIYSALEYFADRRWIQHPRGNTEEGWKELIFKSGHNPELLDKAVAPL